MLKLHRNWPRRPIALPRSGASTGGSTHWTAYKPSRSSNTLRTFVAISPSCCPRSAQSGPSSSRELKLSCRAVIGIPLGFIANELITNAAKYGTGRITVALEANPGKGYALSVANDGPALPEGFDPAAGKGLGMRIIRISCQTDRR